MFHESPTGCKNNSIRKKFSSQFNCPICFTKHLQSFRCNKFVQFTKQLKTEGTKWKQIIAKAVAANPATTCHAVALTAVVLQKD